MINALLTTKHELRLHASNIHHWLERDESAAIVDKDISV
jgi:hypothetical protein